MSTRRQHPSRLPDALPTDDRFRLEDDEGGAPIRPEPGQPSPENVAARPEPRLEGEVLGVQLGAISHDVSNQDKEDLTYAHFTGLLGRWFESRLIEEP